MKKYKLIKEYPGSPKLGTEVEEAKILQTKTWKVKDNSKIIPITSINPENYPEFWQEIKNNNPMNLKIGETYTFKYLYGKPFYKSATITRFTDDGYPWAEFNDGNNGIITEDCWELSLLHDFISFKLPSGVVENAQPHNLAMLMRDGTIHSVKRVSDGEVFTVGDVIDYNNGSIFDRDRGCKITFFSLYEGNIFVNSHHNGTPEKRISDWIKLKSPILTTEDGVTIYEPRDVWVIDTDLRYIDAPYKSDVITIAQVLYRVPTKGAKIFSSEELAREYILMNKPLLSLNDVFSVYPKYKKDMSTLTHHATLLTKKAMKIWK